MLHTDQKWCGENNQETRITCNYPHYKYFFVFIYLLYLKLHRDSISVTIKTKPINLLRSKRLVLILTNKFVELGPRSILMATSHLLNCGRKVRYNIEFDRS